MYVVCRAYSTLPKRLAYIEMEINSTHLIYQQLYREDSITHSQLLCVNNAVFLLSLGVPHDFFDAEATLLLMGSIETVFNGFDHYSMASLHQSSLKSGRHDTIGDERANARGTVTIKSLRLFSGGKLVRANCRCLRKRMDVLGVRSAPSIMLFDTVLE